jgi:hypothetical protein
MYGKSVQRHLSVGTGLDVGSAIQFPKIQAVTFKRRPGEGRDPYRVIYREGDVAKASFNNRFRWLWVPAPCAQLRTGAGTTWMMVFAIQFLTL